MIVLILVDKKVINKELEHLKLMDLVTGMLLHLPVVIMNKSVVVMSNSIRILKPLKNTVSVTSTLKRF